MKVLLILINTILWRHIRQSLSIWISTSLLGSLFLCVAGTTGLPLEEIVILSLGFSAPAAICLFPTLYFLRSISTRNKRILFALAALFMICLTVIAIFLRITRHFPFEEFQVISLLLPYVLSAALSFFLIARKLILSKNSAASTLPPQLYES